MATEGRLTCPHCGHVATAPMPEDACVYFFECPGCKAVMRPLPGDCCVFCSYGDQKCPPRQQTIGVATGIRVAPPAPTAPDRPLSLEELEARIRARLHRVCLGWPAEQFSKLVSVIAATTQKYESRQASSLSIGPIGSSTQVLTDIRKTLDRSAAFRGSASGGVINEVPGDPRWLELVEAFAEVMEENRQDAGVLQSFDVPQRRLRLPLSAETWWIWEPQPGDLDQPSRQVARRAYHSYRALAEE